MSDPTQFLRRQRRETDPNHRIRVEYRKILRAAKLRISGWPLVIRRSKKHPKKTSGHCYYRGRIVVTIGIEVPWEDVCALLAHEVAHAKTPYQAHGPEWRSLFVELVDRVYGVGDRVAVALSGVGGSSFDLHAAVQAAIAESQED